MTIVLGQRLEAADVPMGDARRQEWVARFTGGVHGPAIPAGPPPVPLAEVRLHMPDLQLSWGRTRRQPVCQDGLVGLYAARLDVHRAQRMTTGRTLHVAGSGRARPCTIVRETTAIGRGAPGHYQRLYPGRRPQFRRLRGGGVVMGTLASPWRGGAQIRQRATAGLGPAAWRAAFSGSLRFPRIAAPRRLVMASLAALLIIAGAATSGLAQQRYEVQPGETLETVAARFGVDAEGIRRSSYMPNGDALSAGQVIIIPDPGQSPAEAAEMAAQLEGTSPWVTDAHWVEAGDTLGSIGAAYGVSPEALASFNEIADPTNLLPGQRILIPYEPGNDTAPTPTENTPAVAAPIVNFKQTRSLSCEYAATHAATTAFGAGVPEQVFIDEIPLANNPHYGYRGNIDGQWGNTTDYGIYPEALVPTLNRYGFAGEVMYTEGDVAPLQAQLDAGRPVVVWLGFWGDTREVLTDQDTYSVFAGMHVVTVYGYNDAGVFVMDPAKGTQAYYDWARFQELWAVTDGMGLAVYPA